MSSDNHELSITRFIAAPPQKVWEVMTRRQTEWWCPLPWRAEVVAQEWRAGGRCDMVFKGPDGEEEPQVGTFLEVTPGVRFVTTDAAVRDAGGQWHTSGPFMIGIWEVAPEDGGTRYTARALHWDADSAKSHADMGFTEGWNAATDQLVALCETGD